MAESQTPAAAPAATTKPGKPDQDAFNEKLAQAEKEYQDALKKYVSPQCIYPTPWSRSMHHADGSRITMHPTVHRFPPGCCLQLPCDIARLTKCR